MNTLLNLWDSICSWFSSAPPVATPTNDVQSALSLGKPPEAERAPTRSAQKQRTTGGVIPTRFVSKLHPRTMAAIEQEISAENSALERLKQEYEAAKERLLAIETDVAEALTARYHAECKPHQNRLWELQFEQEFQPRDDQYRRIDVKFLKSDEAPPKYALFSPDNPHCILGGNVYRSSHSQSFSTTPSAASSLLSMHFLMRSAENRLRAVGDKAFCTAVYATAYFTGVLTDTERAAIAEAKSLFEDILIVTVAPEWNRVYTASAFPRSCDRVVGVIGRQRDTYWLLSEHAAQ